MRESAIRPRELDLTTLLRQVEVRRAAWQQARPILDARLADRFNPLDFLRTNELGLSAILRWMLDAGETHGQGDLFLRLFLSELDLFPKAVTRSARARCEVPTDRIGRANRRLDVLVTFGTHALAIENKPDAGWQADQVKDYLAHLASLGGTRTCLLVLKGERGDFPKEQLAVAERKRLCDAKLLIDTDYEALLPWLRLCASRAEAERVRHFLLELARHIEHRFLATGDTSLNRAIVDDLLASPHLLLPAADILGAREPILTAIGERFDQAIRTRWSASGVGRLVSSRRPNRTLDPRKTYTGLDLEYASSADVCFRIQFDRKDYTDLAWGLDSLTPLHRNRRTRLADHSERALGYSVHRPDTDWVWWQWIERADADLSLNSPADVWRAMADPHEALAAAVVAQAERMAEVVQVSA